MLSRFRDLDKLMLIDLIADGLSDGVLYHLHDGLADAFVQAESDYGKQSNLHPGRVARQAVWQRWRDYRHRSLGIRFDVANLFSRMTTT